jgi:hypothetical protein
MIFLDKTPGTKLNHDHINHISSPIIPKEMEAVINSLPTKKKKKKKEEPRARARWFKCRTLSHLQRRPNTNISQMIPQNKSRRNTT